MKHHFFTLLFILSSSTFIGFACQNQPKNNDNVLEGAFSYLADANMFTSCDGSIKMPVQQKGEYLALERKYLETAKEGGQKVYIKVKATVSESPKMEGTGTEKSLLISEIIEVGGNKNCPALQ